MNFISPRAFAPLFFGAVLSASAEAATITTFANTSGPTPLLTNNRSSHVDVSTGAAISGPLGQNSNIISIDPSLPARADATSMADSTSRFESWASLNFKESNGQANSGGLLSLDITRQDASITAIPFTVSRAFVGAIQGSKASLFFSFRITDPNASDPSAIIAQEFAAMEASSAGTSIQSSDPGGFLSSATTGSGFDLSILNGQGLFDTTNIGTEQGLVENYTGALDISGLQIGRQYSLGYLWETKAEGKFAGAHFVDPINFSGSGIGIDRDVLAKLTGSTLGPVPVVPLPAAAWALITGLAMLGAAGAVSCRRSGFSTRWAG
ncbi:VPLPA-CTERM sorting domain-containing protein [Roseovarius sp. CAU 1744]|uniref:VPLPA-CTERM sorting domain-containing protein n=1 Tax=Roseovarius sp. CAU 1744 TaxID=3140368 RepID=UPI00325B9344